MHSWPTTPSLAAKQQRTEDDGHVLEAASDGGKGRMTEQKQRIQAHRTSPAQAPPVLLASSANAFQLAADST
eukprot:498811-Rhodomonas_salina.1